MSLSLPILRRLNVFLSVSACALFGSAAVLCAAAPAQTAPSAVPICAAPAETVAPASASVALAAPAMREFADARVVVVGTQKGLAKAAAVLAEEIALRTGRAPARADAPTGRAFIIGLESDIAAQMPDVAASLSALAPLQKEGYKFLVSADGTRAIVAGADARGVLYGVGHLLRKGEWRKGSFQLASGVALSTSPAYPVRGMELAPSPRAKHPDEPWAKARFERLVRELALFGMNSAEISRTLPEDYARIVKAYGLDVWILSYYRGDAFKNAKGIAAELKKREGHFKRLPAIDHLMVKTGDPGRLDIETVFDVAEKEAAAVRKYHPKAKVWLAPQQFVDAPQSYFDKFCELANAAKWLDGVAFGPWCRMPVAELRAKLRPELPIRNFPDITHIYASQYPLPALDLSLAQTLGRICINPTPETQKHIHNRFAPLMVGSIAYSEGTNDDVNKFQWMRMDWEPETSAADYVRDYARFFIGADYTEDFTRGIFMLERNLSGRLDDNAGILDTLAHWQKMEARADAATLENPRFLMGLLRAYYDAYIYQRRLAERDAETRAVAALSDAKATGAKAAVARARALLSAPFRAPELRARIEALYTAVYRDAARWTMEYQHCPLLDQIDVPLSDAPWWLAQLAQIDSLGDEAARLARIDAALHRTDPGEGGFYYNLGDLSSEAVTRIDAEWADDPSHLITPHSGFGDLLNKGFVITPNGLDEKPAPRAWLTQAGQYYDRPMSLRFTGFDPAATYRVRVAYVGEASRYKSHVSLDADGRSVHESMRLFGDVVREFDLPAETTADGEVVLTWRAAEGERGVHVGEVFFIKR